MPPVQGAFPDATIGSTAKAKPKCSSRPSRRRNTARVADEEPAEETDDDTGCTRCDAPLIFLGRKDFHEGGFFLVPGMLEGRTNMEMWACSGVRPR